MPPNIIVVEKTDDIFSPQYAFIGNRGLLSDLYEKHEPREDGFTVNPTNLRIRPRYIIYHVLLLHLDPFVFENLTNETIGMFFMPIY